MLERRLGIGEGFEAAAPVRVVVVEITPKGVTLGFESPCGQRHVTGIRWHRVEAVEVPKSDKVKRWTTR